MKTAIVYYSKHHGNTKKLLDKIAENNDVTLFDITKTSEIDLTAFDRVGFASGIYYSKFNKNLLKFAQNSNLANKETFFVYTYGAKKEGYTKAIREAMGKDVKILGEFGCFGFNTFGPFKLVGGIAKGHPNADDFKNVLDFYNNL